jgi:hypothetical protein
MRDRRSSPARLLSQPRLVHGMASADACLWTCTLLHGATSCHTVQPYPTAQRGAPRCDTLQCSAPRCIAGRHGATQRTALQPQAQYSAPRSDPVQRIATGRLVATQRHVLQRSTAHRNAARHADGAQCVATCPDFLQRSPIATQHDVAVSAARRCNGTILCRGSEHLRLSNARLTEARAHTCALARTHPHTHTNVHGHARSCARPGAYYAGERRRSEPRESPGVVLQRDAFQRADLRCNGLCRMATLRATLERIV